MNTTLPPALPSVRLLGAVSFIFLSTMGILMNSLLIIIFYKGRKSFKSNAFFIITYQLIFCDMVAHLVQFIVPIPVTMAGYDIFNGSLFHTVPCSVETFAYYGTLYFSFLMTVNRITVFLLPSLNQILFKQYIYVTITFTWAWNFFFNGIWTFEGCYKIFTIEGFHYLHTCSYENEIIDILRQFFTINASGLPIFMLIAYIILIIFIKIKLDYAFEKGKLSRKPSTTLENKPTGLKREFQLLAQGFLICGVIELENLVFNILPQIQASGQWIYLINFIGNWTSLLLCCIHPIVLFTFNQDIRSRLENLLFPARKRIFSIVSTFSHD